MASASMTSKARALAARTVHVKIYPTTRTFNERREVLRVLERFGEVTMFRSFKVGLTLSMYAYAFHLYRLLIVK